MSQESIADQAGEVADNVTRLHREVESSAKDACQAFRKEACHMMSCASDKIRANPLPAVAGAFTFGIAVGALLMSGRSSAHEDLLDDLRGPLADAGENLSSALRGLYGNLKFW